MRHANWHFALLQLRMAVTNGNNVAEADNGQPLDLTVLGMNSGTSMVIKITCIDHDQG